MDISLTDRVLIYNALHEKAQANRKEVALLKIEASSIGATLLLDANRAEEMADDILNASSINVR